VSVSLRLPQGAIAGVAAARHPKGGYVQMGEEISLEVIKVDERQSKVLVKDLPDPDGELADRRGQRRRCWRPRADL
jgi:hypothetical protein